MLVVDADLILMIISQNGKVNERDITTSQIKITDIKKTLVYRTHQKISQAHLFLCSKRMVHDNKIVKSFYQDCDEVI